MLIARATSKQVKALWLLFKIFILMNPQAMSVLNHAGVCLSYDATLIHMKNMVDKEDYMTQVQQGRWLWVYDNFNMHQAIRHERQGMYNNLYFKPTDPKLTVFLFLDTHNTMVNVTTRIAVKIKNLPPFDFNWDSTTPQKPRGSVTVDDVLPSEADGETLFHRVVNFVKHFLVKHFQSLKHLKVEGDTCALSTEKSTIVPMPLINRDEKYTDETIRILHDYVKDCGFVGDFQV